MDKQHAEPVATATRGTPPRWQRRQPWLMALVASTIALLVTLVVVSVAFVHPATTSAAQVPATATPTTRPGYRYYTETASNFQVQYPLAWQTDPQNPGVEIDDVTAAPSYIMQVLLPIQNLDAQTDWIQYEFSNLKQKISTTSFTQIGQRSVVNINGIDWQSALAQVQQSTTTSTLRVLVTRHHDRIYIINLLAASSSIEAAEQRYFNDMLGTFAFLA